MSISEKYDYIRNREVERAVCFPVSLPKDMPYFEVLVYVYIRRGTTTLPKNRTRN